MCLTSLSVKNVALLFATFFVIWLLVIMIFNERKSESFLPQILTNKKDRLVFWSNDFHISPINDLKNLLQPLGVRFIDKSLSGHCHVTNTCGGGTLRVINQGNAMDLRDPTLIKRFFEAYRNDAEMKSVDAFICFHPASMCELFMPFNKTLIVIASTRYELGRFGVQRWTQWNKNLIRIAANPKNVVGANNKYDLEYIRYFTGIKSLKLLPSFCGYVVDKYAPTRLGFLLSPIHHGDFSNAFMKKFKESCRRVNCKVELTPLREKYAHYKYSDLTAHPAIVHVPYQVSVMSLFEQYRMNIPLIFPSVKLLAKWQHQHMVMNERTWDSVLHGVRPSKSAIEAHPSQRQKPDPNNERNLTAIKHWIQYADFYQLPYIIYFKSTANLVRLLATLTTTELNKTSHLMETYNAYAKIKLTKKWKTILKNSSKHVVLQQQSARGERIRV